MDQTTGTSMGIAPPRLRAGDTVGVCAPASPVAPEGLRRGVQALSQRYRVRLSEAVLESENYLAGHDDLRADDLNRLIRDPDVRAIIPANGGYGITRILDRLDADALRADPKIIVGFSEGTALLCWALAAADVRGIHGPMVSSFGDRPDSQQRHMLDMLEGTELPRAISCRGTGGTPSAGRRLRFEGPLLGGNLTVLSVLTGTRHELCFDGALMFFEDVGKPPYSLDRKLTHLYSAGTMTGVKVALSGELLDCTDRPGEPGPAAEEVVGERFSSFHIPLLTGLPVGHGVDNFALPFGARAAVDFQTRELTFLEGAVS